MSTRARVDPRAADELEEAADWYDRQRAGLGRELVLEVRAAVRSLALLVKSTGLSKSPAIHTWATRQLTETWKAAPRRP